MKVAEEHVQNVSNSVKSKEKLHKKKTTGESINIIYHIYKLKENHTIIS